MKEAKKNLKTRLFNKNFQNVKKNEVEILIVAGFEQSS